MATQQNNENFFPELRIEGIQERLRSYAESHWIKKVPIPIERITLHWYDNTFSSSILGDNSEHAKYVLLFHCNPTTEKQREAYIDFCEGLGWHMPLYREIQIKRHREDPGIKDVCMELGIDAIFPDLVYKGKPQKGFLEEWYFTAKLQNEDIPKGIDINGHEVVVYSDAIQRNVQPHESSEKKLSPSQEDKAKVQEIGKRIWAEYRILDIHQVAKHPEILKIVGRQYRGPKTVPGWLSKVAPERARKHGKRPKDVRAEQERIGKELGIISEK